ncbi:Insulin-like growth factor-binding protein complex acid labile chain [Gryllus bimaculatus]|nr:Insulin-like growth factor-binding protein complex acid labile chain [Gryllus bimaculatus]
MLTMTGCKLTTLKNVLPNTSNLITLDISNNELKELNSEWFEMAKGFTTLNVSHNHVESLNIDGSNLKKLVILDLSHNKVLKDFDPDVFESMPVLQTLDLTGTLLLVPSGGPLFSHETISHLFLSSCGLSKELPAGAFSELPNLDQLDLSRNSLFGIEGLFISSTNLRILDLSGNNILSLTSDAFSGTLALEELYLNNNALNSFNLSTIVHLSSLRVLDISITPLACSCSEDHWLLDHWTNETDVEFKNTCPDSSCDWDDFSTTTEPEKKCWHTLCNKGEKCCSNGVCAKKCSGVALSALPLTSIMIIAMVLTQIDRERV